MRGFFSLAAAVVMLAATSCGVARYGTSREVMRVDEESVILSTYYPQLYSYYVEGVLRLNSIRQVTLPDGTRDYVVRYKLVRYRYTSRVEMLSAVEMYLPELFDLYRHGMVTITSVYKYVDRSTGRIMHHATYHWVYNYYPYGPWSGVYYNYRRVRPLPPPNPGIGRFPGARAGNQPRPAAPATRPGRGR